MRMTQPRLTLVSTLALLTLTPGCVSLEHARAPTPKDCQRWDAEHNALLVATSVALGAAGAAGGASALVPESARVGTALTSVASAVLGGWLLREAQSANVRYVASCSRLTPVFEPEPLPEPVKPPVPEEHPKK